MPVTVRHYDDFDLQLRPAQDGAYEAAVLRSPAGEARQAFALTPSPAEVAAQLPDVAAAITGGDDAGVAHAIRFGAMLFSSLFTGKLLQLYDQSLSHVQSRGRDLRIRLRVLDDALLAALPWELLYDTREQRFIALQPDVLLTRTAEAQQPIKDLAVTPPLRVLAMVAQPSDLAALEIERERRHLERSLARLGAGVELHWVDGQSWRVLRDALQRGEWHVFHFLGHGLFDRTKDSGALAFAGDDGLAELHTADDLSRLLGGHDALRLVVLNACEGAQGGGSQMDAGIAQQLVRAGVPAVVAMQAPVAETHAAELTRSFYGALGNGLAIDAAFAEARKALSLAAPGALAWAVPVLVMRSGDDSAKPATGIRQRVLAIPAWALGLIIAAACLMVLVAFWVTWPYVSRQLGLVTMPKGSYNIAVAPFQPGEGGAESNEQAIARAIYLRNLLADRADAMGHESELFITVWGPEEGIKSTDEDRVAEYAERINAAMVVYGRLENTKGRRWTLSPQFYVRTSALDAAPEFRGAFALGAPIEYRANSDANLSVVNRTLRTRVSILVDVLLALSFMQDETNDGYLQAASILDRVAATVAATQSSSRAPGAEIVYLFLGNAYLLLADSVFDETQDLAAATEYSNRAKQLLESGLELNPSYARLHLALAEVSFGQASSYDRPQCVDNWAESAADIGSRYQAALDHLSDDPILQSAGASSARWLQLAAELGLARVSMWRYTCSGSGSVADEAVARLTAILKTYETNPQSSLSRVAIAAYLDLGYFDLLRQLLTIRQGKVTVDDDPVQYWQSAIDVSQKTEVDSLTDRVKQRVKFECGRVKRLQEQKVFLLDVNDVFATYCEELLANHNRG